MDNIIADEYRAIYDQASNCIYLEGVFRLQGGVEYEPIYNLLRNSIQMSGDNELILDISKLTFLNSSGIALLSKFVIEVRKTSKLKLTIEGSTNIPWQGKSLNNLQRLMPNLILNLA